MCRGVPWIVPLNVRRSRMFRSCMTSGLVPSELTKICLKKMRPGDIHTHVFAQQFPIILADGKINPALAEARARGVIFDVGHGAGSFWFRNAVPAQKQGFVPDSMSTDLHEGNLNVVSMTIVMSKFLAMGVPLDDIIRRSTVNPAAEIRRPELGTLTVGEGCRYRGPRTFERPFQLHRLWRRQI